MWTRIIAAGLIALILDQLSKWVVLYPLGMTLGQFKSVIPGYFHLILGMNDGINFGLFSGSPEATKWILIAVAFGLCFAVLWWMRDETRPIVHISTGLLIGGALGNVVDRFIYGAVVDFINVTCCGIHNPFSFNVADIFVFAGAIGLVIFAGNSNQTRKA